MPFPGFPGRRMPSFRPRWHSGLRRVTIRQAVRVRDRRVREAAGVDIAHLRDSAHPDDSALDQLTRQGVVAAVLQLPRQQRAAVGLRYLDDVDPALVVNRVIETAAGTFDCADPSTPCHLRVERDDANLSALRSDDLRFDDTVVDRASLAMGTVYAERQQVAVRVERAPLDESVKAAREEGPEPGWATLGLRLCVIEAGPWLNDCTPLGSIAPDDEGSGQGTVTMSRELFSYGGWQDCAEVRCAVVVSRAMDYQETPGGSVSWPRDLAVALVVADPTVPAVPRPSLTIVEWGPDDEVEIVGEHFRPGSNEQVGICHEAPKVAANYSFYVYPGAVGGTADADGRFELTMRLPRVMLGRGDAGEEPFVDCAERPGRCHLGIVTGEGMPPMVRTPIDFPPE